MCRGDLKVFCCSGQVREVTAQKKTLGRSFSIDDRLEYEVTGTELYGAQGRLLGHFKSKPHVKAWAWVPAEPHASPIDIPGHYNHVVNETVKLLVAGRKDL